MLPELCVFTALSGWPAALATYALAPSAFQSSTPNKPGEKETRTPAQRKINSQLLYEIYRRRGQAAEKQVPPGPTGVDVDEAGRALVDIRTTVTPEMERKIRELKGVVVSTAPSLLTIIARIPLLQLERLAGDPAVRAIEPAAEAITNR